MRRLIGAALALLVLGPALVWAAKGEFRFFVVDCTSTRAHVAASNSARTALTIQNAGTGTVYLGSSGGPQVLTTGIGFTLHAGSVVEFGRGTGDPTVQVECISGDSAARGQRLNVMEEW